MGIEVSLGNQAVLVDRRNREMMSRPRNRLLQGMPGGK